MRKEKVAYATIIADKLPFCQQGEQPGNIRPFRGPAHVETRCFQAFFPSVFFDFHLDIPWGLWYRMRGFLPNPFPIQP